MEICKFPALVHLSEKKRNVPVFSCDISRDGEFLLTGALDCRIRLWQISDKVIDNGNNRLEETGDSINSTRTEPKLLCTLSRHEGAVLCVRFHPRNRDIFVSSSDDKLVLVWQRDKKANGSKGNLLNIPSTSAPISTSHVPPLNNIMGKLNSVGGAVGKEKDKSSPVSYVLKHRLANHASDVLSVAFTPDGRQLISCSLDNTLVIYDFAIGEGENDVISCNMLQRLDFASSLKGFCVSDKVLVAVGAEGSRFLWTLKNDGSWAPGGLPQTSSSSKSAKGISQISSCFFQRPDFMEIDSQTVICLPDCSLSSLPTALLVQLEQSTDPQNQSQSLRTDMDVDATGEGDLAKHIENISLPVRWKQLAHLVGHAAAIEVSAICPITFKKKDCSGVGNGGLDDLKIMIIALACQDGSISLWCNCKERPIVVFSGLFEDSIFDLRWSSDGKLLIAVSKDGTVAICTFDWAAGCITIDSQVLEAILPQSSVLYGSNSSNSVKSQQSFRSSSSADDSRHTKDDHIFRSTLQNSFALISNASDLMQSKLVSINDTVNANAAVLKPKLSSSNEVQSFPPVNETITQNQQVTTRTKDGKRRITPILVTSSEKVNLLSPSRPLATKRSLPLDSTPNAPHNGVGKGASTYSLLAGSLSQRKNFFEKHSLSAMKGQGSGNVLQIPIIESSTNQGNALSMKRSSSILARFRSKQWIEIKNCTFSSCNSGSSGKQNGSSGAMKSCLISLQVTSASPSLSRWQDLLSGFVCNYAVASSKSLSVIASYGSTRILLIYDTMSGQRKSPVLLLPSSNSTEIAFMGLEFNANSEYLSLVTSNGVFMIWSIRGCKFIAQIDCQPIIEMLDSSSGECGSPGKDGWKIQQCQLLFCQTAALKQVILTICGWCFSFNVDCQLWSALPLLKPCDDQKPLKKESSEIYFSRERLLLSGLVLVDENDMQSNDEPFCRDEEGQTPKITSSNLPMPMLIHTPVADPVTMLDLLWRQDKGSVSETLSKKCKISTLESHILALQPYAHLNESIKHQLDQLQILSKNFQ